MFTGVLTRNKYHALQILNGRILTGYPLKGKKGRMDENFCF